MGVAEACKSPDHEAVENHQVEGPETKGHSHGKGQELTEMLLVMMRLEARGSPQE